MMECYVKLMSGDVLTISVHEEATLAYIYNEVYRQLPESIRDTIYPTQLLLFPLQEEEEEDPFAVYNYDLQTGQYSSDSIKKDTLSKEEIDRRVFTEIKKGKMVALFIEDTYLHIESSLFTHPTLSGCSSKHYIDRHGNLYHYLACNYGYRSHPTPTDRNPSTHFNEYAGIFILLQRASDGKGPFFLTHKNIRFLDSFQVFSENADGSRESIQLTTIVPNPQYVEDEMEISLREGLRSFSIYSRLSEHHYQTIIDTWEQQILDWMTSLNGMNPTHPLIKMYLTNDRWRFMRDQQAGLARQQELVWERLL